MSISLTTMTPRAQEIWLEAYELGATHGWARGYKAAEDDMAALWRHAHAIVRAAVRQPSFPELCELRGEPERAAGQRRLMAERGITT